MKRITCLLALICCFHPLSSLHAQWVTLYEGGAGTSNNLHTDWAFRFFYASAPGSNTSQTIGCAADDQGKVKLLYYNSDFGNGSAGIYKHIPGMENYAALRIFLEMDLPDSIGTVHYAALTDELFTDQMGVPIYDEFATGQLGVSIPYSNTAGYNSLYFFADLLRGDSVTIRFNYVRIEADTTQMLHLAPVKDPGFTVYSSGEALHIQTGNQETNYQVHLFNALGHPVLEQTLTGNQDLLPETAPGTYIIQITSEDGELIRKKIYIE